MVQFGEETHVNGLLRVVRYGRFQAEAGVRYGAIYVGSFVHSLNFHYFGHSEKHAGRVGFKSQLLPIAHQFGESHREGAVFPSVGKGVSGTVEAAFPALRSCIIAGEHVAHEVFGQLKVVLVFGHNVALQGCKVGSVQVIISQPCGISPVGVVVKARI